MKIKTKDLALIAMYAALYAALVVILGGLSYGPIQVRVADSMLGAVPLLGIPGVLGAYTRSIHWKHFFTRWGT